MFPELCPVCNYMSYKEESGEYYSDGMQISPNEGYCSHCDFRYSQHVKHSIEEQVKKHIKWLKKMSDIYKEVRLNQCSHCKYGKQREGTSLMSAGVAQCKNCSENYDSLFVLIE